MCFVWIWEQTAIISLYSINWLVFITETECVYCAVRTGPIWLIIIFGSLAWQRGGLCSNQSQSVWELWWTKWQWDGVSPITSVSPCQYNSTKAPYWSSSTRLSYQKHKRPKSGDFPRSSAVLEIAEHWTKKCCRLVFSGMTLTGEDRNTRRKACPIATTNPIRTDMASYPGARWQANGRTLWTFQKAMLCL